MTDQISPESAAGTPSTVSVVVAGALASKAGNGGEAWVRMSWFDGVSAAGHDVWLFEQIDEPTPDQILWFDAVTAWFNITDRACLVSGAGVVVAGADADPVAVARSSQILLNISGHLAGPSLFEHFDHRVLIDIDPGYTQMWHVQGLAGARVDGHHAFATIGENINDPRCAIPTAGLPWVTTRQPVRVDTWAGTTPPTTQLFSTVAAWRGSYGPVDFNGVRYGIKAHEFRKIIDLPLRCPNTTLELALAIHDADIDDRDKLEANGWVLTDPHTASGTPERFRDFIHASSGELSVAQEMYVDTNSGWFSDRTVRYLAAGRPAIVQDTGFTANVPTGQGLLAFTDTDSARDALDEVASNYDRHALAAERIARDYFSAETVVADLFKAVL